MSVYIAVKPVLLAEIHGDAIPLEPIFGEQGDYLMMVTYDSNGY